MTEQEKQKLFELIAKKLSGEASEQEQRRLDAIIQHSDEVKNILSNVYHIWSENYFPDKNTELIAQKEVCERIWNKTFVQSRTPRQRGKVIRLSAIAAIIIALLTTLFMVEFNNKVELPAVNEVSIIQKQTLPGQKSTITLKDGTVVWLNSGSSIKYWSDYNEKIRLIELEGQAFFEVFEDQNKPFLVKCGDLKIEALGTSFDVNGYRGAPIQVSLLTGSVQLSVPWQEQKPDKLILKPGEYSVIGENNQIVEKGNFDPYEVMSWKEGRLIFDNAKISEIIPKLELWYGVKINNNLRLNLNKPYTSTFERENLENILMNMGGVLNFSYEIKENNVTLIN